MRGLRRFFKAREGATALEFALIAPMFFALIFGILEVCLIVWFNATLIEGADAGTSYMRQERLAGRNFTTAGLRTAICDQVSTTGLSCDASKLKIGAFYAGVPVGGGFGVPDIIENYPDPRNGSGGQYILAVGYYWGIALPTSQMLLRQGASGSQIQARTYTVLSERVWDDGVSR